jgi:hypothetical protein
MRNSAGLVPDVEQERRNRVRDCRADTPQDVVAADVDAVDVDGAAELRDVARTHFEKEHALPWKMVRLARLAELVFVLLGQARVRPVGDDANRRRRGFRRTASDSSG